MNLIKGTYGANRGYKAQVLFCAMLTAFFILFPSISVCAEQVDHYQVFNITTGSGAELTLHSMGWSDIDPAKKAQNP